MSWSTDKEQEHAVSLGFVFHTNEDRREIFIKGSRSVWFTLRSLCDVIQWQTADMIKGSYTNHQKFTNLIDALNREMTK